MRKSNRWWMVGAWALCAWAVAALAAAVEVSVSDVTARQRYPWNGMVDIDYELACSDPATNVSLHVLARDSVTGKALPVRTVKLEGREFGEKLVVQAQDLPDGKGRLVWDAAADAEGMVSPAVMVEMQALIGEAPYLVLDLSAGSGQDAVYPASFLGEEPPGGWGDEFKTTKLVLRRIQPGTFTMGCETTEVGYVGAEAVPHDVTISEPFYIGVFEVTQKQWELVMGKNPSYFTNALHYAKRPVEQVSYNEIRGSTGNGVNWPNTGGMVHSNSFVGKLRARTSGFSWDLPTEAQWEYACRAGTTTALNSGKDLTGTNACPNMAEVGRYWLNGGEGFSASCDTSAGTAEVGSYLPNAWGLYDMHGNVREWTLDWFQARASFMPSPVTDPIGPSSSQYGRVLHGGSWYGSPRACRSAFRSYSVATEKIYYGGVRLVCSPEP